MKNIITTCLFVVYLVSLSAQDSKAIIKEAKSLAKDLCKCLNETQTSEDVAKCSKALESKYPNYIKDNVPQALRDKLKIKVEKCAKSNYERINADVSEEVKARNDLMGMEISEKLCDCYSKVEHTSALKVCINAIMEEYKSFENDKMTYDKGKELEATISSCVEENLKRLEKNEN